LPLRVSFLLLLLRYLLKKTRSQDHYDATQNNSRI